ncbi:7-deoxyloganetic acid glucosyltransferase [Glycine max]|uniref:7-deoxyloganetic acid glucosyltransferase n=1 Tax=Glycine max TaxID=3847 RepID=UPI001B35639D|nr:7-deoxyloganetic acid glucosyltransferase-like [Glycine max]
MVELKRMQVIVFIKRNLQKLLEGLFRKIGPSYDVLRIFEQAFRTICERPNCLETKLGWSWVLIELLSGLRSSDLQLLQHNLVGLLIPFLFKVALSHNWRSHIGPDTKKEDPSFDFFRSSHASPSDSYSTANKRRPNPKFDLHEFGSTESVNCSFHCERDHHLRFPGFCVFGVTMWFWNHLFSIIPDCKRCHFPANGTACPCDIVRNLKRDDFLVKGLVAVESVSKSLDSQEQWQSSEIRVNNINTFDQLEASIITKLTTIFPKVYTIGPLHTLTKTQFITNNSSSSLHLRKEDKSCITWLDQQKARSVLYVSFGTLAKVSHEQLVEIWHGLVGSLKPFLWVIRQGLIIGEGGLGHNVPMELELKTKERGLMVNWAPQEEVLAHPSVGGFFTHSGWNSTLECITEGVPMLCWPLIADQTVNSRCVSEQWGIGLDMNGICDRLIVEKMVKNLMENQIERLTSSTNEIAEKAHDSVNENGSSFHNIENLIKDIGTMKVRK